MTERTVVAVSEVRNFALTVFDRILAAGIENVELDQPEYWTVFPSEMFAAAAPDPVLADILDDLADLRSEASSPDASVLLGLPWHALHHLAGICSVLSAGTMQPRCSKECGDERTIL